MIPEKTKIELRNLAFNFFRDELAYNTYLNRMEEIFANCTTDEEVRK